MWDAIFEAIIDGIKLLPFLFATYILMEYIENKMKDKTSRVIERAGRLGPLLGSASGLVPQCGFSAAAAGLYAGKMITLGTLVAVYLSTSDEMIPIMISQAVPVKTIFSILALKLAVGTGAGFLIDAVYKSNISKNNISDFCEHEHCGCKNNIFKADLRHTVNVFIFILIVTVALNIIIHGIGEENLARLIINEPVAGEFIAGLIGLIPNCSASVVLTQLYIEGVIGAGPLMSGLLVGAGVGLPVLFRTNKKNLRHNIAILVLLYTMGVLFGMLIGLTGIKL